MLDARHEAIPARDVAAQIQGSGAGEPISEEEREAVEHAARRGEGLTIGRRIRSAELDDGAGIAAGGVDGDRRAEAVGLSTSVLATTAAQKDLCMPRSLLASPAGPEGVRRAPPPSDASSWCALEESNLWPSDS
jgi:hypothetical protein